MSAQATVVAQFSSQGPSPGRVGVDVAYAFLCSMYDDRHGSACLLLWTEVELCPLILQLLSILTMSLCGIETPVKLGSDHGTTASA